MRLVYDLFFLTFSLLYLPYLLIKGKVHRDFLQRFGFLPKDVISLERPIWIHAVSVGEAAVAARLSAEIRNRFQDIPIIVSTTTQTGNDMIRKSGRKVIDAVFYYPLDIRIVVSRVVRQLKPRLYVMIETELWPNLLEELRLKDTPVVLVNGRISETSFANYRKIKIAVRRILACIDCFCMQSAGDAERIKHLGAPADKVFVTGNMKFDEKITSSGSASPGKEYPGFDRDDEIIVAGSTHFPEERVIIGIYKELRKRRSRLRLILAPRHVERADAIRAYLEESQLTYSRLSDILDGMIKGAPGEYDVLLVDTIGHLKDLYSVATVVFIGGSLARKGGQNPIEAARWGKAIIFGPHMFNFREVADIFLEGRAAICVKNALHLKEAIEKLLRDPETRRRMSGRATEVIAENTGAADRTIKRIEEHIRGDTGPRKKDEYLNG